MEGEVHCGAGFGDVDASGNVARLADYLRATAETEFGRGLKQATLTALELRPGSRALDVGCGTGAEVLAMAELVTPGGRALGLDSSEAFIERARAGAAAVGSTADFVIGDAHELPFSDSTFDAVRVERTLQHVADPVRVLTEMVRVTASGGIITAAEPDWDTLVIDLEPVELTRQVQAAFGDQIRHPTIGRSLRRLLMQAGLADVTVRAVTMMVTDAELARRLFELKITVERLVNEGGFSRNDGDRWLHRLDQRGRADTFLAAVTGFAAVASRPA